MNSSNSGASYIGIFAVPLTVEGAAADGTLPPQASIDGARLLIPLWDAPATEPGKSDLLEIWVLEPGAPTETLFYSNPFPVPVTLPGFFPLPAQHLQRDGQISLRYQITDGDGNPDTSIPQTFTVRRVIPVNLAEPVFPSATLWGYLNCASSPKLWESVTVRVPAQPGRFTRDDECTLDWEGFSSLNGVGPIAGTALQRTKRLTQEEADSGQGFDFILGPDTYQQYIKPMEKNASAVARYTLYRNGIALGRSTSGLVKIDRTIPGQSPCGPTAREGSALTVSDVGTCNTSMSGTCSPSSRASPLDNNVDCSAINSAMEFTKMNMQVKTGGGVLALPPTIVDQLPDGRLTHQQLRVDRQITVQLSDVTDKTPEGAAKIELHVFPKGVIPVEFDPTYVVLTKFKDQQTGGDWSFPIDFDIATAALIDKFDTNSEYAAYEMAFIIYDVYDNVDTSTTYLEALVDLTSPWQPQPGRGDNTGPRPPSPALGGVPAVIDDAWLNDPANAGGLNLTIPTGYTKFEANNDKVNFYLSTQTTFPLMQGEGAAVSDFPLPVGGVINIALAFLRGLAEGAYFSSYNLRDLPGNISNNANITNAFRRVKTPAPELKPPKILGLTPISFASLKAPNKVTVEIQFPLYSLPGDRIIPYITSDEAGAPIMLPEQSIPATGTGPLLFDVDYDLWAQVFGDANGSEEVEFECWYELSRPTIPVNPVSLSTVNILNLSYAGPEQPNLPDLENPNLTPVVVQGAGTAPPAPNTLGPAQAGLAAAMNWPVWNDPSRPVTGREIVKFYYQGKLVGGPIPVRVGDTTVTTSLPWATILAERNGIGANAREAYVTVEYPGSDNVMKQVTTTKVDVTAIVINLPVAQIIVSAFRTTTTVVPERVVTSINCPSLNHPTVVNGAMPPYQPRQLRIRIRRDINIPTGATVDLDFEGRTTNAVGGTPIANTRITASATMPATGDLEFRLTNYVAIRTIQLPSTVPGQRPATRYARIAYTVNGVVSETVVPVALLNSSLVYCEQERPEVP